MRVIAKTGRDDIAMVYICETDGGRLLECVESLQPPRPRSEKWVLLVSVMCGCPVGCAMCDAGRSYHGTLTTEEILDQLDFLVRRRYPDLRVPSAQFKIQLSRMGEPSLNQAVIDVLNELPARFAAPGLMPSLSTIAPAGTERFFDRLLEVRHEKYAGASFQFQFSLHTTDHELRKNIIPVKTWGFEQMATYGDNFSVKGGRKITLNFALSSKSPLDPAVLLEHFSPERFLIKITPINPTYSALSNRLSSYIGPEGSDNAGEIVATLRDAGYEVIVSIGNAEENFIGSNCGQFLHAHLTAGQMLKDGYTYHVHEI